MERSDIKYQFVESKVLHSKMSSSMKTDFQMLKAWFWLFLGLNILSSYLKMARYITWNEKGIWTKHFSLKCKLSEFCYISNWLLWVGVLFHAGTRYFSCCILKAEFPSKGRIPGSVTLSALSSRHLLNLIFCSNTDHKNFNQYMTKLDGKSSFFLSMKKERKKLSFQHQKSKETLLHLGS